MTQSPHKMPSLDGIISEYRRGVLTLHSATLLIVEVTAELEPAEIVSQIPEEVLDLIREGFAHLPKTPSDVLIIQSCNTSDMEAYMKGVEAQKQRYFKGIHRWHAYFGESSL